mmetsp:Transcript_5725/g.10283  ORF Transcript_5725/g.10283 Transcript_5725/m.10283 type:complete len:513 (+) Transcript_5725:64-1602(+)
MAPPEAFDLALQDLTVSAGGVSSFSRPSSAKQRGPGEGAITVLSACASAPRYTLAGRWKEGKQNGSTPGPAQYNVEAAEEATRGARWRSMSIPKAGLEDLHAASAEETPGPGFYTGSDGGRIKGGVIPRTGRASDLEESSTPGPGAYEPPPSCLSEKGGAKLGDFPVPPASLMRARPASAPPGGRRRESSVSNMSTTTVKLESKTPGAVPGYSIGNAKRPPINSGSSGDVGPEYMPPSTLRSTGASCRNGNVPRGFNDLELRPGPFTYSPEMPAHIMSAPSQSFTRYKRPTSAPVVRSDDPGPGSYNVPALPSKGCKSLDGGLKKRIPDAVDPGLPGPGDYETRLSTKQGGGNETTFPRAQRETASAGHTTAAVARRAQIVREAMRSSAAQAGHASSSVGRRGPRLSKQRLAPKLEIRGKKNGHPGPGQFNLALPTGGRQCCIIGSGPRMAPLKKDEGGPGPGSYSTDILSQKSTKGGKLRPRSASAGRLSRSESTGPSPQEYKVYSCFVQS